MALKPDRSNEYGSDISFFMNAVAERGGVVSLVTLGSGASMDNGYAVVGYGSTSSGKTPVGILMNDMVDVDLTQFHLNPYKDVVQKGGKVNIRTFGWVLTNMIKSGDTPAVGDKAYLAPDGRITKTNTGATDSPKFGVFLSQKDQDGYAKVSFNFQGGV